MMADVVVVRSVLVLVSINYDSVRLYLWLWLLLRYCFCGGAERGDVCCACASKTKFDLAGRNSK